MSGVTAIHEVMQTKFVWSSSGAYLIGCPLKPGDVILWEQYGGIIQKWFFLPADGLYVQSVKLDLVTLLLFSQIFRVGNKSTVLWCYMATSS